MRSGLRIARLFGINIYLDWSWLLIFFLVTWSLGSGFARFNPGWGAGMVWGVAIIAALLFFASVLAHEMAHALAAKAQNIPVRNITLFLFGGVASIQQEPRSPRAEFIMTIVGPLTSVGLGVLFLLLGSGLVRLSPDVAMDPGAIFAQIGPTAVVLLWLGQINILLGVFNMVPAFPLDGGRVLRSIIWAVTNDFRRATRLATWAGQAFAWLLIFTGIAMIFGVQVPFFGVGIIGGLWLIFIGWFLSNAASRSYQQVVVQDILDGVPAERLMRADVPTAPPAITVDELIQQYVMGTDERAFPIMEDEQLVGLVTLEDIRRVAKDERATTLVREIMTPAAELASVKPQDDATEALNKLMQRDVRQLPVIREGKLVGMVRRRDIMRWLQLHSSGGMAG